MERHNSIEQILSGDRRWAVLQGDCVQQLRLIPPGSVDLIVTDPPFAVSVKGSVHKNRGKKGGRRLDFFPGDHVWESTLWLVQCAIKESMRVLKPKGSMYWWCSHRQIGLLVDEFERSGFKTRPLVWSKKAPPPPPPGAGWPAGAEFCVYAYKPGRTWTLKPRDVPRSNVIVSDRLRRKADIDKMKGHPTPKPQSVVEPLVLASSRPGDLVVDPFCGTGSTAVAALKNRRRFIGFDIDPRWIEVSRMRAREADASVATM